MISAPDNTGRQLGQMIEKVRKKTNPIASMNAAFAGCGHATGGELDVSG
jgi:hypothetical protein